MQALQVYFLVTAATMFVQQAMLRSSAIRTWLGFPPSWPLSPERTAELAKKRGDTMFAGMAPIFRRFSYLAEGDLRRALSGAKREPEHVFISKFGLRDPGAPLPPDSPPLGMTLASTMATTDKLHAAATVAVPHAMAAAATATAGAAAAKAMASPLLANKPKARGARK